MKSFYQLILESQASDQAHKMGLKSSGWGRWKDNSGKVTHQTKDGRLIKIGQKISPTINQKKNKLVKNKILKDIEDKFSDFYKHERNNNNKLIEIEYDDAESVNEGYCYFYAKYLKEKLGTGDVVQDLLNMHTALFYNNLYFDSETPNGAIKMSELPYHKRLSVGSDEIDNLKKLEDENKLKHEVIL